MKRASIGLAAVATVLVIATVALAGVALAQAPDPTPTTIATKLPWIGVTVADLSTRTAARLGISETNGVAIVAVVVGSPAEKAGVKARDVVTSIDGKSVTEAAAVSAAVKAKAPGDSLALSVTRAGAPVNMTIVVGEKPQTAARSLPPKASGTDKAAPWSGLGGLLDGLRGLAPGEAFDRMLGSQWRFLNKDNQAVTVRSIPGIVVSAAKDSLTIKPNDAAETAAVFAITADTQLRLGGGATADSLKPGDRVVVTTTDGKTAVAVSAASRSGVGGWGGGRPSPHGSFGPGLGFFPKMDRPARPSATPTPGTPG